MLKFIASLFFLFFSWGMLEYIIAPNTSFAAEADITLALQGMAVTVPFLIAGFIGLGEGIDKALAAITGD